MSILKIQFLVLLNVLLLGGAARAAQVDLMDGDRVVFMGSAFFERDVEHNYLETMLTIRYPQCNVTFRTVGWRGDTLVAAGNDQLIDYVRSLKPTVLFLAFGMNESLEADANVEAFADRYGKLLDGLKPIKARLVLLSPIVREDVGKQNRDREEHNRQLKTYSDAILKIANERRGFYINLFTRIERFKEKFHAPLTDDGIHLNRIGHWLTARMIEQELGFADAGWGVELDASGRGEVKNALGVKVHDAKVFGGGIDFIATNSFLPPPLIPHVAELIKSPRDGQMDLDGLTALAAIKPNKNILIVSGLKDAVKYSINIDRDAPVIQMAWTGAELAKGHVVMEAAGQNQVEQLRNTIADKNQMFFNAYFPQAKDKGRFAREMPLIEQYIAKKEAEIAKLRVPVMHFYRVEQVN
jgi:hypothetical protein